MTRDEQALATVDAFFRAIESVDPARIAALFAEDAELEDPVGSEVIRGRANIRASFAEGFARLVESAEIRTVRAFVANGAVVAVHWEMMARGVNGRDVHAAGIDVITVAAGGLIERVEGYWDASAFVARLNSVET
jgi:steroid Delta-isomerase